MSDQTSIGKGPIGTSVEEEPQTYGQVEVGVEEVDWALERLAFVRRRMHVGVAWRCCMSRLEARHLSGEGRLFACALI